VGLVILVEAKQTVRASNTRLTVQEIMTVATVDTMDEISRVGTVETMTTKLAIHKYVTVKAVLTPQ